MFAPFRLAAGGCLALVCVASVVVGCAGRSASVPDQPNSVAAAPDAYETQVALRQAMDRYAVILRLARDRGEYETSDEYPARRAGFDAARPERRALEARRYLLTFTVAADPYDADAGAYRVLVSKDDVLAPARGEVAVDRTTARRVKASLTRASGVVRIRAGHAYISDMWMKAGNR